MWVTNLVPEFSFGGATVSMSSAYDQEIKITRPYPRRSFVQSVDGSSFFELGVPNVTLQTSEFEFSFTMRVLSKAYDSTAAAIKRYVHSNLFLRGYRDGNLAGNPVILKTAVQNLREERQNGKVKWTISGQCLPFWYDASETVQATSFSASATSNYSFSHSNHSYTGDILNCYDDFAKLECSALAGTHGYSGWWFDATHSDNNVNPAASGTEKLELYGGPSGSGPSCIYSTYKMVIRPSSLLVVNKSTEVLFEDATKYCVKPTYSGIANFTNKFLFFRNGGTPPFVAHVFTANQTTTVTLTSKFRNLWW